MKRFLLAIITAISLIPFFLSLVSSLTEPQVQTNLELSQTNLLLTASFVQGEESEKASPLDLFLLGKDIYRVAKESYESAGKEIDNNLQKLQGDLSKLENLSETNQDKIALVKKDPNQRKLLIETFNKETVNHQALNLKLGLLAMQLGERETGLKKWQEVIDFSHSDSRLIPIQNTAQLLINLWQSEPVLT
ncbi:MAG: hypothetical protein ACRC6M_05975, partial [Microcystaceae cyanobacterium]